MGTGGHLCCHPSTLRAPALRTRFRTYYAFRFLTTPLSSHILLHFIVLKYSPSSNRVQTSRTCLGFRSRPLSPLLYVFHARLFQPQLPSPALLRLSLHVMPYSSSGRLRAIKLPCCFALHPRLAAALCSAGGLIIYLLWTLSLSRMNASESQIPRARSSATVARKLNQLPSHLARPDRTSPVDQFIREPSHRRGHARLHGLLPLLHAVPRRRLHHRPRFVLVPEP